MSSWPEFEVIPLKEVPGAAFDQGAPAQKRVVLVVDDERVIADTLAVIVGRDGFSTMTAYDGESALKMALENPPDLLLSDVMMGPGMDGVDLAMAVSDACPDCKVLLFSGHTSTRDLLGKAYDTGRDFTLLAKPLHPADLLMRIQETFEVVAA